MITWDNFYLFAIVAVALWILGAGFALFSNVKSRMAVILSVLGTITLSVFIAGFWISLQRPPLRTMGETRLWYSFFMGVSGLLTYLRWKYRWILAFSTIVGTVFVLLNILKPEIHDQSICFLIPYWDVLLFFLVWGFTVIGKIIWRLLITWCIPGLLFLLSVCLPELFGQKLRGGITGVGIPKKLGLLLPGRDICCIYICGYSDVRLHVHCIGS